MDFWSSLWHTVQFTLYTTPPLVVLSLVLAVLVNRVGRGNRLFRFVFFLPYIPPSATVALIWIFVPTPDSGGLATVLKAVVVDPPSWLGDPDWAMPSVAGVTLWWTLGFNFVLYLAALQEIPRELYEAAAIDSAGPWQQTTRVTVPVPDGFVLRPLVAPVSAYPFFTVWRRERAHPALVRAIMPVLAACFRWCRPSRVAGRCAGRLVKPRHRYGRKNSRSSLA